MLTLFCFTNYGLRQKRLEGERAGRPTRLESHSDQVVDRVLLPHPVCATVEIVDVVMTIDWGPF